MTSNNIPTTPSKSKTNTISELDRKILEEDRKILAWIYDILGENLTEKIIDQ